MPAENDRIFDPKSDKHRTPAWRALWRRLLAPPPTLPDASVDSEKTTPTPRQQGDA